MNNIPRSTEVHDHRYDPHCQSLENNRASKLMDRRKDQHVGCYQAIHELTMAQHPTERNVFFDSKGSCQLLQARSLRTVADNVQASPAHLQEPSGCTKSEVTALARNKATDEDQVKLVAAW